MAMDLSELRDCIDCKVCEGTVAMEESDKEKNITMVVEEREREIKNG